MKIAIDVRSLQSNEQTGVGAYIKELFEALLKNSRSTEWVLFSNSLKAPAPLNIADPRVTLAHFKIPNRIFNSLLVTKAIKLDSFLNRRLKINKLDHWFAPNLHFTPLSEATPLTLTIHDITFNQMPSWYSTSQRIKHYLAKAKEQVSRANLILTPSQSTAIDCETYLGADPNKIKALLPGLNQPIKEFLNLDPSAKRAKERLVKEKYLLPTNYILFVGALEPRKNIIAAIRAFEAVVGKLPENFHLILAGSHGWRNEELFKTLERSSAKNRIRYLGYIPESEKAALLSLAKIFVYPSFYEGFGFPVLDALALGIPVVTSPRASLFEVANECAYYAHPERPSEMANGFITLTTDTSYRTKKIALGLAQAQKFSWDLTAKKLLELWGAD